MHLSMVWLLNAPKLAFWKWLVLRSLLGGIHANNEILSRYYVLCSTSTFPPKRGFKICEHCIGLACLYAFVFSIVLFLFLSEKGNVPLSWVFILMNSQMLQEQWTSKNLFYPADSLTLVFHDIVPPQDPVTVLCLLDRHGTMYMTFLVFLVSLFVILTQKALCVLQFECPCTWWDSPDHSLIGAALAPSLQHLNSSTSKDNYF